MVLLWFCFAVLCNDSTLSSSFPTPQVLLDGRDIRELNLRWLREQVGLVGQEPVLFNMSVSGAAA